MAATPSYQLTISVNCDGRIVQGAKTYSASSANYTREAIPDGSVDLAVSCAIDVSAIKALLIVSDQDIALEINNANSAYSDLVLNLVANLPYVWTHDFYFVNLFTVDTTIFYVSNASGEEAILEIIPLVDATP